MVSFRAGRQTPDRLLSRQLANLCIAHSYMRSFSAHDLITLCINGKYLGDLESEEFAGMSVMMLRALKNCANVGIKYYSLARELAVMLYENNRGEAWKDAAIDVLLIDMMGVDNNVRNSNAQTMINLVDHDEENDRYQNDFPYVSIDF